MTDAARVGPDPTARGKPATWTGLAGTGELARLAFRRDRIALPAGVYVITALVAGTAYTFRKLYPTAAGRAALAAAGGTNPALRFLYGRIDGSSLGSLTAWRYGMWAGIFAALMAAFWPAGPLPMTTRSNSGTLICGSLPKAVLVTRETHKSALEPLKCRRGIIVQQPRERNLPRSDCFSREKWEMRLNTHMLFPDNSQSLQIRSRSEYDAAAMFSVM